MKNIQTPHKKDTQTLRVRKRSFQALRARTYSVQFPYGGSGAQPPFTVVQCLNSKIHLGHKSQEWNPNIASYILGERSGNHVFDVSKQLSSLKRALRVVSHTASICGPGSILFLGKSPEKVSKILRGSNPYEQILKNAATSTGASFFSADSHTWVNGSFTNWNEYIAQNKANTLCSEPPLGGTKAAELSSATRSDAQRSNTSCSEPPLRGYCSSGAFNNFVIGSDTSGIQFPYGGIGAAFKCSFGW